MRSQSRAHATPGRPAPALRSACGALIIAALTPAIAFASHYVVNASGGGDFTTLQAAVDATIAAPRDSLLVAPGTYPGAVAFTGAVPPLRVVGVAGAAATHVRSIAIPEASGSAPAGKWAFDGLTFDAFVDLRTGGFQVRASHCVFAAGLHSLAQGRGDAPFLSDCDFGGRTWLPGCSDAGPGFVGLRFVRAPLVVTTSDSGVCRLRACTFEGPADTLVVIQPVGGADEVSFHRCTFRGGGYGVVTGASCATVIRADSCRFENIAADALREVDALAYSGTCLPARLAAMDSRFDRCGTAVRWTPGASTRVDLVRDSVFDCPGDGIVVSPGGASATAMVSRLVVERCGGDGFVVARRCYGDVGWFEDAFSLSDCRFRDNRGDGCRVVDTLALVFSCPVRVTNSVSERNRGAGFRLAGMNWSVRGNVALANGGDGLVFRSRAPTSYFDADSIVYNTCAANGGDGLRLEHDPAPGAYVQVARNDLLALNLGRGLVTDATHDGSVAFNDAWSNTSGDFANVLSPADSNLSADPQFCDLAAGDVRLAHGSPCGGGGAYRAIGARAEACVANSGPGARFSAHPNPARGAIEFTVPAGGPAGRIVILDVQGRRVWSRAVRAGERVAWTGQGAGGRVPPGLFFVRLERPGENRIVRVVWLE